MEEQKKCPGCGMPLIGNKCEYCGTQIKGKYDDLEGFFFKDTQDRNYKILVATGKADVRYVDRLGKDYAIRELTIGIAEQYIKMLLPFIKVETFLDPCDFEYKVRGFLKVVPWE